MLNNKTFLLICLFLIFKGKLPLTGIIVNRLEDSDTYKNAFEINSPLIDRIVAVCQGPNDANKWVELLTSTNVSMPIGIKRQLSNLSNASISGGHISTPPNHVGIPFGFLFENIFPNFLF